MEQLFFGVAYYDEYMPYDRLNEDIRMMKDAGIDVVGWRQPKTALFV